MSLKGKQRYCDSKGVKRAVNVYLTRNSFGKENQELVGIFLKATNRANEYLKKDPQGAVAAIAGESKFPEPVIAKIISRYDTDLSIKPDDIAALGEVKSFLQETKTLRKDFVLDELFDLSYLKKAGF